MNEIVAGLAAYRVARLITTDAIFERQRLKVHVWLLDNRHTKIHELVQCGYCVSVWTAFAFTARRRGWLKAGLAAAGVAAVAVTLERIADGVEE